MSKEQKIVATLSSEGYAEVSNGLFNKKVSLKDFASVINSLIAQEDQVIENSTVRYPSSIHSVTRTNTGHIANLYFPEAEAEVRHTSGGKKTIYMPNVMIRVELREIQGKVGEFSLGSINWYATDKSKTALSTEWPTGGSSRDHIWTLPFPNIFGSASMCTGGNRLPSVIYSDWTILDMLYYDVLIGSPFNNDLSVPSLSDSVGPRSWIDNLHDHWKDEESERFPYDLLVNY